MKLNIMNIKPRTIHAINWGLIISFFIIYYLIQQYISYIRNDYVLYSTLGLLGFSAILYAFMYSDKYERINKIRKKLTEKKQKIIDDAFEIYKKDKITDSKFYTDLSEQLYEIESIEGLLNMPKDVFFVLLFSVMAMGVLSFAPTEFYLYAYLFFIVSLYFIFKSALVVSAILSYE